MKAKAYAVTIQWGGGLHYFRGYTDGYLQADALATRLHEEALNTWKRTGKRAKPITYVWHLAAVRSATTDACDTVVIGESQTSSGSAVR